MVILFNSKLRSTGCTPYMMGISPRSFNIHTIETMSDHHDDPIPAEPPRTLSDAARRALEEAETRRRLYDDVEAERPTEKGGRGGLDPARYGDWEVKGRASDF